MFLVSVKLSQCLEEVAEALYLHAVVLPTAGVAEEALPGLIGAATGLGILPTGAAGFLRPGIPAIIVHLILVPAILHPVAIQRDTVRILETGLMNRATGGHLSDR